MVLGGEIGESFIEDSLIRVKNLFYYNLDSWWGIVSLTE